MIADFDLIEGLKALAEPSRLAIVGMLLREEMKVTEIHAKLGISRPNTSGHLRVLRLSGLVQKRPAGQNHLYVADKERVRNIVAGLRAAVEVP